MSKKVFYSFIFIFCFISFFSFSFSADPKLVTTINKGFEQVEKWILKISTPAAAVAVGTGIFIQKFSFGDEERIRLGKKVIRSSLFAYGFILAIDLILAAIKTLV